MLYMLSLTRLYSFISVRCLMFFYDGQEDSRNKVSVLWTEELWRTCQLHVLLDMERQHWSVQRNCESNLNYLLFSFNGGVVNCPALLFSALNKPSNLDIFVIDRILLRVFHFRVFTLILRMIWGSCLLVMLYYCLSY